MWTASRLALSGLVFVLLGACSPDSLATDSDNRAKALALWQSLCKKSGEFVHRTVDGVSGIYLIKVRPQGRNFDDQFGLTDPYGDDFGGNAYVSGLV